MTQRDDENDEAADNDEATESEADVEAPSKRASASSKSARGKSKKGRREAGPPPAAPSSGASLAVIVGLVALAAGAAAGWFGHEARAKAKLADTSTAATAGSSGPCNDWQKKICSSTGGEESATCQQAKGAAELLTTATCETALAALPATLAKVKAARATCDNLVSKLCADLPKGSSTCKMVSERTKSFPTDRCKELSEHYTEVLGELKQIDEMGGPEMMGGPRGAPPGMPPGMPMPQGMPPGMPQGSPPP